MKVEKKDENKLSTSSDKVERDEAFIERLRILAEKVGSVSALAKASGISQSGMQRYFNGGDPGRKALIAIALACGVSIEWLATGKGVPDNSPDGYGGQPTSLDAEVLAMAIDALEQAMSKSNYKMKPKDKAELIASNYDLLMSSGDKDAVLGSLKKIFQGTLSRPQDE